MSSKLESALQRADVFIAAHPEYTRAGVEQIEQCFTNSVVFARRNGERVVFKILCEPERKARECFALAYWKFTGLTPTLICDADETLIVLSFVPGMYLKQSKEVEGIAPWRSACRDTGKVLASLMRMPMPRETRAEFESKFFLPYSSFEAYARRIVALSRGIVQRDPDFQDRFWVENLDFIEAQLPAMLRQPAVLYHQDAGNLHVQGGRLTGLFDLEQCRIGCAAMQVASCLGMVDAVDGSWELFCAGWEQGSGQPLDSADLNMIAAGSGLLSWRTICRYMSYDGTPGSGFHWASPANPKEERAGIERAQRMLR